jgi:SRSO17 transposase
MTVDQISSLGSQLAGFLDEFADCFGRPEPSRKLAIYVRGQLSDLPRKSCEPLADWGGIAPRSLQEFLATDEWDHERACQRLQEMVVRDHGDRHAIGIIDESGHPKKGSKTACVSRQYCGNTGKIDNCVVTVHLTYASYDSRFRTMLESTPYLPEKGWDDEERRRQAKIPQDVQYRSKYQIALEQLDRARGHGVTFGWITADEWYGQKPAFLAGLEQRGQRYVVEIPRNVHGWLYWPGPAPRNGPRPIENLVRYSLYARRAPPTRYYVKDTGNGPILWEVRAWPFWMRRGDQVIGPRWLLHAVNVLDPAEEKYFLSNASPGTPLSAIVYVGFTRWPVERCLEDEKTELGMSHFEVRGYRAIQRHLIVTQISHLFLARQANRLRGGKSGGHRVPGSHRRQRTDCRLVASPRPSPPTIGTNRANPATHPKDKRPRTPMPHPNPNPHPSPNGHPTRRTTLLPPTLTGKGAL